MELKLPKTTYEQLNILKDKKLLVESDANALKVLESINYYTFTGYLYEYKNKDGNYAGITFEKAHRIYQCDMRIRSVILYAIESAERNLKTKISYYLAHNYGPLSYESPNLFKDKEKHKW